MRRTLARGARVGLGMLVLGIVAACSKAAPEATSKSVEEPSATATATPTAAAPPPMASAAPSPAVPPVLTTEPPPPAEVNPSPTATATAAAPHARPAAPKSLPAPTPKPSLAGKPSRTPDADDGLHATPAPNLGVKKVSVLANNHYTCSSTEKRDNVAAVAEPRGARISIVGQGPCPGEVHDWSAQITERRIDVQGTHGAASKCRCVGSGELVLRGLDPGTYDIAVNGGFDRPIATRITVLQ